jgi:hypothetical protein
MKEYLIITPAGEKSLFPNWIDNNSNFDLILLVYEDNVELAKSFKQYTSHVYLGKGEKWMLIKSFIQSNLDLIQNYKYIWFPDDDIEISPSDVNKLFEISKLHDLYLSQPAMVGYVSHEITKPVSDNLMRYTNFVEVLAPMFKLEVLLKLYDTFDLNYSSWGYDYLWPHLLGYPKDKIAIIDDIIMNHTRPVGQNYSRFPKQPWEEMNELLYSYNIQKHEINYLHIKK